MKHFVLKEVEAKVEFRGQRPMDERLEVGGQMVQNRGQVLDIIENGEIRKRLGDLETRVIWF